MVEITKLIFLTLFRLLYWKSGVIMQSQLLLESNLQVAVKSPGQTFEVACCLWCTMLGFQQKHSDICLSIKTYSSLTAFNKTTVLYTAVKYVQCEKIWKYLSPVTHVQRHTSRALLLHIQLMKTIHAAIKSAMMGNMKDINLTMPSILSALQYQKKHCSTVGKHSS